MFVSRTVIERSREKAARLEVNKADADASMSCAVSMLSIFDDYALKTDVLLALVLGCATERQDRGWPVDLASLDWARRGPLSESSTSLTSMR